MATGEKVECGIIGHQVHSGSPINVQEIQAYFRRAEELGFHSIWMTEQSGFRGQAASLESMTLMSYAAGITSRIRLGVAVLLINMRNPMHIAKGLASIDQLSQGRLIAGVAMGGSTGAYGAYGIAQERRVARFNETLNYVKKLWTEEKLNFEGEFFQVKDANLLPKPYQKPYPPIWFGGGAPAVLKRAVTHGNGFIGAGNASSADFKSHAQILRQELDAAGKDPKDFAIGKRVFLAVDKDRERAGRRLKEWFKFFYNRPEQANRVSVWGSPEQVVEGLQEVVAGGARLVILSPVYDMAEQMEILASEVVPHLTGMKT